MKNFIVLTILLALILFPIKITAQELVLYYPFEGTGDKVVDESGMGNDGSFDKGNAKYVAGKETNFGKAMEFDGKSRIAVKESNSLKIDTKISFAMWVKKADEAGGTGTLPRIISRTADVHELAMDSGHMKRGNFAIYFGGNPGWTSCMPVDLDWHHIAVTFDGSTFNVYLDGKAAFNLKAGGARTFTGILYVGSRCDLTSNEYYAGLLDELAIYNGVLTQGKVEEIMTGGVVGQLLAVSPHGKLASTWSSIKAK
jgi:hypothetical protein